jgi:hypothetical protein
VHGVAALGVAEAVALDGLGEDHRRLAARGGGVGVGRVDLLVVLAAALDGADLLVREAVHERLELGDVLDPVLALHVAGGDGVELVVAVDRGLHALAEQAVPVPLEQRIPAAAPDHLDHVPVGAAEAALQLLDDLAVAAHGTVEALQVAVDHQHEVVEALAAGDVDRAEDLGLVGLAVAEEAPDPGAVRFLQAAALEVLGEARLGDRRGRRQAHGGGRQGPEVGHAPRVRVGRQAAARPELAAEVGEARLGQASLEPGAGVDAGRGVGLDVERIGVLAAPEEVVEAHLQQRRRGQVGGDVAADPGARVLRLQDHGRRVPADQVLQALLELDGAGIARLGGDRDGVDVGRVERRLLQHQPRARGVLLQAPEQFSTALLALLAQRHLEGVEPLADLLGPGIGGGVGLGRHGASPLGSLGPAAIIEAAARITCCGCRRRISTPARVS